MQKKQILANPRVKDVACSKPSFCPNYMKARRLQMLFRLHLYMLFRGQTANTLPRKGVGRRERGKPPRLGDATQGMQVLPF